MNIHCSYRITVLLFCLVSVSLAFHNIRAQTKYSSSETILNYRIHSKVLNEERSFSMSLPASYENGATHYPVLIILDGEDFLRSFAGMVEYYSKLGRCPELIVVGIHSEDRWRDYTPTHASIPDGTQLPTSGGGGLFLEFIHDDLLPFIDAHYRTTPFHVLFGHSIAGLFVINGYFEESARFSAYIATSPSLWWDRELMVEKARSVSGQQWMRSRYLFFSIGNEDSTMSGPVLRFSKAMERCPDTSMHWTLERFSGVDHQTMPIKAFCYGLEYIFNDWQMPQRLYEEGLAAVLDYFDTLSARYLQTIVPPERVLNRLGYMVLNRSDYEEALRIFKMNIKTYPGSANAYDSLGEAYMNAGDFDNAISNYKKSLELNPENTNARKMLRKLENQERNRNQ